MSLEICDLMRWKVHLPLDQENQVDDEIDLGQLLETLWRGRGLIIAIGITLTALGGLYGSLTPDRYVAQTRVLFQSSGLKELSNNNSSQRPRFNTRDPLWDEHRDINTQALIAMGEDVVRDVIDDLALQTDTRMHLPTSAMAVGLAMVNGTADTSSEKALSDDRLVRALNQTIRVTPMTESTILLIEANTVSASLSADLANAFAQKYIDHQVEAGVREAVIAIAVVDEALDSAQQELERAQVALREHIAANAASISEEAGDPGVAELAADFVSVSALARSLTIQRSQLETQIAVKDFDAIGAVLHLVGNEDLESELRAQLFSVVNTQRSQITSRLEDNPESRELKEQLDKITGELTSLAVERLSQLVEQVGRMEELQALLLGQLELAFYAADLSPEVAGDLFVLQSQSTSARETFLELAELSRSLKLEARTQVPSSRIISRASIPVKASGRGPAFFMIVGAALGFLLSSGLVILSDRMRGSVQGARSLQRFLGVQRLSVIRKLPDAKGIMNLVTENPSSPYAESLRRIGREAMTNFALRDGDGEASGQGMVLVLTSSVPNEGKSTTALGLAALNAMGGQSICLVDLALRDSGLSSLLGLQPNTSLNEYLRGIEGDPVEKTLAQLDTRSPLTVIGGSQLIGVDVQIPQVRERIRRLLDGLRARFDLIIVDTSPLLSASEALTITQLGDVSLFVVRENFAPRSAVHVAWQELLLAQSPHQPIVALSFVEKRSISHNYAHRVYGQIANAPRE